MAGKNALFRIMKHAVDGLVGLTGLKAGEAIGTKIAALVTAFQDASGNAVFPVLNNLGQVPVTFDSGNCLHKSGALAATATLGEITAATITLTVDQYYRKVAVSVSAMSESCFQLIHLDDVTETIIWRGQVGPGQFTVCCNHACLEFQAGASGTQKLLFKAANANTDEPAELQATISVETSAAAA